jgi:Ca2+-binding EF-hand superfamily protein
MSAAEQKIKLYLQEHRIQELFESLTAALSVHQPDNIRDFLTAELKKRQPGNLITSEEIKCAFELFDLEERGEIEKEKAVKSLGVLGIKADLFQDKEIIKKSDFISEISKILEIN